MLFEEGDSSGGFIIYIHNNTLYAGAHNGSSWSGHFFSADISSLDTSQWHNVALSLDASDSSMQAWFNGSSMGSISNAQSVSQHTGDINLGASGSNQLFHDGTQSGSFNYEGKIDNVRIYNRALNRAEVAAINSSSGTIEDTFNYTIRDRDGGTSSASITLTLTAAANQAPVAANDTFALMSNSGTVQSGIIAQGILGNDRDGDNNSLTITTVNGTPMSQGETKITGTYGVLAVYANGSFGYAPSSGTRGGEENFTYTISDGTTTAEATLTIKVLPAGNANVDSITVIESDLPAGSVYVTDSSRLGASLMILDPSTGDTHYVGDMAQQFSGEPALGLAANGTLYAIDNQSLYTINPETMAITTVGAHGRSVTMAGLTVAPDGTLYACSNNGEIFTVNPNSGVATSIGSTNLGGSYGDLVWHDGALYASYFAGNNQYQIARIDITESGMTATALPNAHSAGSLYGLTSVNGELLGIMWTSFGANTVVINTTSGTISRWEDVTATMEVVDAANQNNVVSGNVLTNDANDLTVSAIALADGTSQTVTANTQATLQGRYGTIIIESDGSYYYTLDNSLDATNNLSDGEVGSDQFVYTATDARGTNTQSILTVSVTGSNERQLTDAAQFTDYTAVDSVDGTSTTIPIDFTINTENSTDKITEIRISETRGMVFNVPSILLDNGTITGNGENDRDFIWTATPGTNAGLDSFDAVTAGLTLSAIGQTVLPVTVSAKTQSYDGNGALTDDLAATSTVRITLAPVANTQSGTSGNDTLTGTSGVDEINGGAGNDLLSGSGGIDFFTWNTGDEGTANAVATDTISDFSLGIMGDVIDLRGLLPDAASNSLDEYLSFSFADGNTTIGVSTTAGGDVVQNITLTSVDVSAVYGTTDVTQLTNQLTDNGNLLG